MNNYINMVKEEFKNYNLMKLKKDVISGLSAAIVALPLALALGLANGLDATAGIISAILGGIIIGVLGGGRFQINGATASTSTILSLIALQYGINGVLASGIIVATIMLLFRISKLAIFLEKIPSKVLVGINGGIGLLIIAGEIDTFLGVESIKGSIIEIFTKAIFIIVDMNILVVSIGLIGILFLMFYPNKLEKIMPSSLMLLIIIVVINMIILLDIDTVEKMPEVITFDINTTFLYTLKNNFFELLMPSINVATILMVKSITSGLSASKITNTKFSINNEISALSIGNYILPFFGCVPSAASFSSTQVAIMTGGRTRIISVFHSLFLLIMILFLAPIMSYVPLVSLSSILIYTGIKMIKKDVFTSITSLSTLVCMLFFDISISIIVGVAVYYIHKKIKG